MMGLMTHMQMGNPASASEFPRNADSSHAEKALAPTRSPDDIERPLRAMTPQRPRVTVVRSDQITSGEWTRVGR